MSENQVERREVRPAIDVLGRLRGGRVMEELADAINAVTEGVVETGKKGSITLTINISKVESTPNGVVIKAEVMDKPPEPAKATDVFFADDSYNLFTQNPRQRSFFDRPRAVLKPGERIDPDTGELLTG